MIKLKKDGEYLMGYNENNVDCCYYPLTPEAKELDLPLLPNPFEEVDVKKLAERYFIQCEPTIYARHKKLFDAQSDKKRDYIGDRDYIIQTYIKGYKAAQQSNKQFSLEDIEQILFDYDNVDWTKREHKQSTIMMKEWLKDKIQSLSTQQLPSEFILGQGETIEEQVRNGNYIW